ncbi:unnamed protein product [Closterium sp. NIES-54]
MDRCAAGQSCRATRFPSLSPTQQSIASTVSQASSRNAVSNPERSNGLVAAAPGVRPVSAIGAVIPASVPHKQEQVRGDLRSWISSSPFVLRPCHAGSSSTWTRPSGNSVPRGVHGAGIGVRSTRFRVRCSTSESATPVHVDHAGNLSDAVIERESSNSSQNVEGSSEAPFPLSGVLLAATCMAMVGAQLVASIPAHAASAVLKAPSKTAAAPAVAPPAAPAAPSASSGSDAAASAANAAAAASELAGAEEATTAAAAAEGAGVGTAEAAGAAAGAGGVAAGGKRKGKKSGRERKGGREAATMEVEEREAWARGLPVVQERVPYSQVVALKRSNELKHIIKHPQSSLQRVFLVLKDDRVVRCMLPPFDRDPAFWAAWKDLSLDSLTINAFSPPPAPPVMQPWGLWGPSLKFLQDWGWVGGGGGRLEGVGGKGKGGAEGAGETVGKGKGKVLTAKQKAEAAMKERVRRLAEERKETERRRVEKERELKRQREERIRMEREERKRAEREEREQQKQEEQEQRQGGARAKKRGAGAEEKNVEARRKKLVAQVASQERWGSFYKQAANNEGVRFLIGAAFFVFFYFGIIVNVKKKRKDYEDRIKLERAAEEERRKMEGWEEDMEEMEAREEEEAEREKEREKKAGVVVAKGKDGKEAEDGKGEGKGEGEGEGKVEEEKNQAILAGMRFMRSGAKQDSEGFAGSWRNWWSFSNPPKSTAATAPISSLSLLSSLSVPLFPITPSFHPFPSIPSLPISLQRTRRPTYLDMSAEVKFSDVAGLGEIRRELEEVVEFFQSAEKYRRRGSKIPSGILLCGEPGSGKTLLAKAVAGEAGVSFFSVSASQFVEIFVGVGASRVRALYNEARENAPSVVFIDELDAVGRQRGLTEGSGGQERDATLNQLLTCLDGFEGRGDVITIAATNRPDILDAALVRPGRFDRKIYIPKPSLKGRAQILEVHSRNKVLDDDVDFEAVAQVTDGMSGAELANVVDVAALRVLRENRSEITTDDMLQAAMLEEGGYPSPHEGSPTRQRQLALNEAALAVVAFNFRDFQNIQLITVVPRMTEEKGSVRYKLADTQKMKANFISASCLRDFITVQLAPMVADEMWNGAEETCTIWADHADVARRTARQVALNGLSAPSEEGALYGIGVAAVDAPWRREAVDADASRILEECRTRAAQAVDADASCILEECRSRAAQVGMGRCSLGGCDAACAASSPCPCLIPPSLHPTPLLLSLASFPPQRSLVGALVGKLLVGKLLEGKLLVGKLLVGKLLVGKLLVGKLLVGKLLVGKLLVGKLLVGKLLYPLLSLTSPSLLPPLPLSNPLPFDPAAQPQSGGYTTGQPGQAPASPVPYSPLFPAPLSRSSPTFSPQILRRNCSLADALVDQLVEVKAMGGKESASRPHTLTIPFPRLPDSPFRTSSTQILRRNRSLVDALVDKLVEVKAMGGEEFASLARQYGSFDTPPPSPVEMRDRQLARFREAMMAGEKERAAQVLLADPVAVE